MTAPVDGSIEQDAHGRITRRSAEAAQIVGWSDAEAIGMPIDHRTLFDVVEQ